MRRIKFMLDYGTYPLWVYNEEGKLPTNCLIPTELVGDLEIIELMKEINETYIGLFVNDATVFEYKGFATKKEESNFGQKIKRVMDLIKQRVGDSYVIETLYDY